MIERRPLGTGPRPTTPPTAALRGRLAAELAPAEQQGHPPTTDGQDASGAARRPLGTGPMPTDR
ncbi:hypothetical protein [Streptomyces virginiae]|uniref:hypothetical protein n=1 Tax=Streptomyces virginiae TaxID=1961 RepID=UPI0030E5CC04